jgi:hypothetical protein
MKTVCDGASSGFPAGFWSDQPSTAAQEVLDEMLASRCDRYPVSAHDSVLTWACLVATLNQTTSTRQLNPTVDT